MPIRFRVLPTATLIWGAIMPDLPIWTFSYSKAVGPTLVNATAQRADIILLISRAFYTEVWRSDIMKFNIFYLF
jgi:hypothetical protein